MSYQKAYTTQFHGLDDTLWNIDIYIEGYDARPVEIKLEGDEPCVIDWQETGKTDVVQSSTCTLRVSNESDRQMTLLMSDVEAAVIVSRDGKWYWLGHLDDAIYEEPYSFTKAYVTELTFSDFGILNRIPFTLKGRQSVRNIVWDCLDPVFGDNISYNLYTSLLEPKSQQPLTLDMLYINADRFEADADSWGATTTKREVLEEVLRPLGLRIVQKNAQPYIYDIEYLRDHPALQAPVVWKGTDAYLRGSETYGRFEVGFEPDALETLADSGLDYDKCNLVVTDRYFALDYTDYNGYTGFATNLELGFYIAVSRLLQPEPRVELARNATFFRTRPVFTDSSDLGVAWRIQCRKIYRTIELNGHPVHLTTRAVLADNLPSASLAATVAVFSLTSGYLPGIPDRDSFQLRVNLDFLLSFRDNPLDDPPEEWVQGQSWYQNGSEGIERAWRHANYFQMLVPVKLEVLDDAGNPIWHYRNATVSDEPGVGSGLNAFAQPLGIGEGAWVAGAATFADMVLAYYKDYDPDDTDRDPLVTSGWVGNRIALAREMEINGTLYRVRDDGEYLPLPPVAGRLRLTVGSGVFPFPLRDTHDIPALCTKMAWQMYRNPEISIVKADRREDGIDTEPSYERDAVGRLASFSETIMAGTWAKGIAPSARGLLFNASGTVWEQFAKNGTLRTLQEHRLRCIEDQALHVQPVITGTAELDPLFRAKLEASTPGVFLVTALRQNLHQATEHITMARIANVGNHDHEFAWSQPCCALEEEPFTFAWSQPHCTAEPHFSFGWGSPACVAEYGYSLEWEEMQPIID